MSKSHEVGFRKPPKKNQFKPGHSGNPKGRPKGTKNLKTDFMEELKERITLRENGVEQRHSKQRVLLKSLVAKAMKGDVRATSLVLDMTMRLFEIDDTPKADIPLNREEEAILNDLEERLLRRHAQKEMENNDV